MDRDEFFKNRNSAMQNIKNLIRNPVMMRMLGQAEYAVFVQLVGSLELSEYREEDWSADAPNHIEG